MLSSATVGLMQLVELDLLPNRGSAQRAIMQPGRKGPTNKQNYLIQRIEFEFLMPYNSDCHEVLDKHNRSTMEVVKAYDIHVTDPEVSRRTSIGKTMIDAGALRP